MRWRVLPEPGHGSTCWSLIHLLDVIEIERPDSLHDTLGRFQTAIRHAAGWVRFATRSSTAGGITPPRTGVLVGSRAFDHDGIEIAGIRKVPEELKMKFAIPAFVLLLGIFASSTLSFGKPEYTKKEKKGCAYCHVTAKSKDLNEAGQYYKDHEHSLKGYEPKQKEKSNTQAQAGTG